MKMRYLLFCVVLLGTTLVFGQESTQVYLGVDLSYVNEMDDCGAVYTVNGEARDPYQIFADYGATLVRVRLWHSPDWTEYSNFEDVVRSLKRAEALGMSTLLDFHYSDTWADPSKQIIPAAWAEITDIEALGEAVYQYTFDTLTELDSMGLLPDLVQVGNEINSEILRPEDTSGYPIDWDRNAYLINRGIQAVRDVGSSRVVLHIAQPEEVEGWLLAATRAGVTDYDIIGISYYPGWSDHSIATAGNFINQLRYRFGKEVMIAETAYPWTMRGVSESAGNIVGEDFLEADYAATPEGQRQFMVDLTQTVIANGGIGVIYWEPAWVSTPCSTLWGKGSHWENATFFDFEGEVLPAMEFLRHPYEHPVDVTLTFSFEDETSAPDQIFFWGDFTGTGRRPLRIASNEGAYVLTARVMPGTTIRYQFYGDTPVSAETALLPAVCRDDEGYIALIVPDADVVISQSETDCPVG